MKDRIRISITLRPEVVHLLDSRVDGIKLRNRSHAVEQFLKESLSSPIEQAVILAGDQFKPLTVIDGKTVIEAMLLQLKKIAVKNVIICTKEKSDQLKKFLSKKQFSSFKITFIEKQNKGTAASLLSCKTKLKPENFILIYGDVLAQVDFMDLVDFHKSHTSPATMVITSVPDPLPWGVVKLKRNKIVSFLEKPDAEARLTNLINAGIFVFRPEIFASINDKTPSLEKQVFPVLASESKLYAYLLDGSWFDIGEPNLLRLAQSNWKNR